MDPTQPRPAESRDAAALGHAIGTAFAHDPVSRWTFGDPPTVEAVYGFLAERLYVPAGHSTVVDGGGALWLAPGQSKALGVSQRLTLAQLVGRAGGPRHIWRALQVDRAMRRRRPTAPHFYLFAIGVLPEARGRGVGRRLLRHTLEIADRRGVPTYLENTNPRNTPLYARLGFTAAEPFAPAPGCPPLVPMWRAAPTASGMYC